MVPEDSPPFEMVLELPEHIDGPVELANGDMVDVGDSVQHPDYGIGKVYRIATYHDEYGVLLCVEFPGNQHKMLGLKLVKKFEPSNQKSPGGGSFNAT